MGVPRAALRDGRFPGAVAVYPRPCCVCGFPMGLAKWQGKVTFPASLLGSCIPNPCAAFCCGRKRQTRKDPPLLASGRVSVSTGDSCDGRKAGLGRPSLLTPSKKSKDIGIFKTHISQGCCVPAASGLTERPHVSSAPPLPAGCLWTRHLITLSPSFLFVKWRQEQLYLP